MNQLSYCSCGGAHNPLHCIVPPFIIEAMAESSDKVIRENAISNIEMATEARVRRSMIAPETVTSMLASTQQKHRLIYDMQGKPNYAWNLPGTLVRSEGQAPTNDNAVDEAYDHSGSTYDFYDQIFGRNSLDDNGLSLVSSVHIGTLTGKGFNNAFWNGNQMGYGDGDGVVFYRLTKALDVVGHELTHGVVSFTCKLVYQNEPGAINEHFADVFGSLIKQWDKNQDANQANWLIGDEIIVPAPNRRALRDMRNPGTAYKNDPGFGGQSDLQPDHIKRKYTGSQDYGGVHINSGILNKAFCESAINIGGNAWVKAGRIWYDVMTMNLNSNSNFNMLATSTKLRAEQLFGTNSTEHKAVIDGWSTVGL